MKIHFNNPEYTKQRQEVKPLSLEEMEELVSTLNDIFNGFKPTVDDTNIVQRLLWEYENLKHADTVKPCQCCYKNTTYDMDVKFEYVKGNERD